VGFAIIKNVERSVYSFSVIIMSDFFFYFQPVIISICIRHRLEYLDCKK
jgi:hypothetical protein